MFNPTVGGWAEVGWIKWHSNGSNYLYGFWETAEAFTVTGHGTFSIPVGGTYTASWKVVRAAAADTWTFWANTGGGMVQRGPGAGADAGFSGGEPEGETGRRGTETSAYDHHSGARWKSSDGNWYAWPTNVQQENTILGYFHVPDPIKGDEWEIRTV